MILIFLDLNMPRNNGLQCQEEMKNSEALKDIPVVIFSTSLQDEAIARTYERGASFYIRKLGSFSQLKNVIKKVMTIDWKEDPRPSLGEFVLLP